MTTPISPALWLALIAEACKGHPDADLIRVDDQTTPRPPTTDPLLAMREMAAAAYAVQVIAFPPTSANDLWITVYATGCFGFTAGDMTYLWRPDGLDAQSLDAVADWLASELPPAVSAAAERVRAERASDAAGVRS